MLLKRASPVSLLKVIKDEIKNNFLENFLSREKKSQTFISFGIHSVIALFCCGGTLPHRSRTQVMSSAQGYFKMENLLTQR